MRPLNDDGTVVAQGVSRDYLLELDRDGAPALTVFGGKITTARHLAEKVVAKLARALRLDAHPVTRARCLAGLIDHPARYAARILVGRSYLGEPGAADGTCVRVDAA